jgi:XTP/dITP diphosphohydrolase
MPAPAELVIASRNRKKIGELQNLLRPLGVLVRSVDEFPAAGEVVEDGETFAANAAKKAAQVARETGRWALGEDSGLRVDALQGAPGVYSARFSGPQATDETNNALLIEKLQGMPAARRGAAYVCHVAIANPEGTIQLQIERTCRGRIAEEPYGSNGFGYDPYFLIPEYHRTFGELSPLVKQQLSHRARALQDLLPRLQRLWT